MVDALLDDGLDQGRTLLQVDEKLGVTHSNENDAPYTSRVRAWTRSEHKTAEARRPYLLIASNRSKSLHYRTEH